MTPHDLIRGARERGETALSEADSKRLLAAYGVPVAREHLARTRAEAVEAARSLGGPVALKGCHWTVQHKTELGLVRLGLADPGAVAAAYDALAPRVPEGGGVLVQEMASGKRELLLGLVRDPQFGACVSLGLGGIFAEILEDVSFRAAPFDRAEAAAMLGELKGAAVLDGFRGMPPVDRAALCDALVGLGRIGVEHPEVGEIDVNPVIVAGARPVAVDALVILRRR